MTEADNTGLGGGSTPMCVESVHERVEIVLEPGRRRWYPQPMTKEPVGALRGIRPEHMRDALARSRFAARGKGHSALARHINTYQQVVTRILSGETEESAWKWQIVQALRLELWQIAIERNNNPLKKELTTHGLQPKDDDVMTTVDSRVEAGSVGPEYTFDLFEPRLGRGDSIMVFSALPTAKTLPPSFEHSANAYAFRMIGDMMRPRYLQGDELYVDPAVEPRVGDNCLFRSADRSRAIIGQLVGISSELWQLIQRPETSLQESIDLLVAEWPVCEKIVGVRHL